MIANIIKNQIFHKIKDDLRGHVQISKSYFLWYIFCLAPNLLKTFQDCQHYEEWRNNLFIKWSMTAKVIQVYIRPLLCYNHSNTLIYGPILISWRHNFKIIFFWKIKHEKIYYIWSEMSLVVLEKFVILLL